MKIAVISSGRIGGVVGRLWARAGHRVYFSSRRPETLDLLVAESGPNAPRGSISEALAFGEVILVSIPYGSLPAFGEELGVPLAADDDEAMEVAAGLARDAGFDPVLVGPFDYLLLTLGTQAVTLPFALLTEEHLLRSLNEKFLYYTCKHRSIESNGSAPFQNETKENDVWNSTYQAKQLW
jgi:hypothetical protein